MLVTSVLDVCAPHVLYNTPGTHCTPVQTPMDAFQMKGQPPRLSTDTSIFLEFRFKETLMPQVDHCVCVLRDALYFTSVIQNWGPRASPLIIRCTKHLEDASGILHFSSGSETYGRPDLTDRPPRILLQGGIKT
eukprot:1613986-Pyramimonas_sp.AAC.1